MRAFKQVEFKGEVSELVRKLYQNLLGIQNDNTKCLGPAEKETICFNSPQTKIKSEEVKKQEQEDEECGSKEVRKKYRVYSVEQKRMIVSQIKSQLEKNNCSLYSIFKSKSMQYNTHIKNLSRWYNLREIKEREGGRKAAYPQIQQKLIDYIQLNPDCKRRTVISLAKKFYREVSEQNKKQIVFSKGWYERFKSRCKHQLLKKQTTQQNTQQASQQHLPKRVKKEEEHTAALKNQPNPMTQSKKNLN